MLGSLLGSIDGFVFAGEVRHLWMGISRGRKCGCGMSHGECELWSNVLEPGLRFQGLDANEVIQLQERAAPSRHSWWTAWRIPRRPRSDLETPTGRYFRLVSELYRRLSESAGGRVIVDSSKHPAEAALLRLVPDLSLHVVQLVRDPRGTVFSHLERRAGGGSRPSRLGRAGYMSGAWLAEHLAAQHIRETMGESGTLLRYEDYIEAPETELAAIASRLGVEVASMPVSDHQAELATAHPPNGNGRFGPRSVTLRPAQRWMSELSSAERFLTTALTVPLLRRYGYPTRLGRRAER
jgi:hypothetical protein